MEIVKNRNVGIDFLRLLGSLAVVGIHVCDAVFGHTNIASGIIFAFTSFAVPCFFITSGYFFRIRTDTKYGGIKPLLYYICVYLTALVIYSIVFYDDLKFGSISSVLLYIISPTFVARHLWFMTALILGWLFLYVFRNDKIRMAVSTLILICGIMGDPFTLIRSRIYDLVYPHLLSIPFMYFGLIAKVHLSQFRVNGYVIALAIALTLAEGLYWYEYYGITSQFYVSTYLLQH